MDAMREPSWHMVACGSSELLATLPASMCCNCGTTVGVERSPASLASPPGFSGETKVLRLQLPACRGCAPTLGSPDPRVDGVPASSVLGGVVGVVFVLLIGFEFAHSAWQFAAMLVAAALLPAFVMRQWRRRAPRGGRLTNYQPVRLKGADGLLQATCYVSFANPAYAELVSAHCGQLGPSQVVGLPSTEVAALPTARIVRRPEGG